uniref:ATP-dependent DNA helicase n=1 Tax=Caenorhabditis japonica TaxID=281687 RepID=A0A8R1E726_CAEJA
MTTELLNSVWTSSIPPHRQGAPAEVHPLHIRHRIQQRKEHLRTENHLGKNLPFGLKRTQFPVKLAFAIIINKAQGQSFERVGL